MHVLTPIVTKVSKFVLYETFNEPLNVVDEASKAEIDIHLCTSNKLAAIITIQAAKH